MEKYQLDIQMDIQNRQRKWCRDVGLWRPYLLFGTGDSVFFESVKCLSVSALHGSECQMRQLCIEVAFGNVHL